MLPIRLLYAPEMIDEWSPESLWEQSEGEHLRLHLSDRLDSLRIELSENHQLNGAFLLSHKGQPLMTFTQGMANFQEGKSLNEHSAFQLASVSKMFTATAVMLLQQDGLLCYDDLVRDHLPEWPYENQTIRHLLTHRSGLARYMAVASWYWKDLHQPMSNADVLSQYAEHKPVTFFTPDNGFNYCNTNYVILAELVERLSGMSFPDFLANRIFQPLDMTDAYVYVKGQPDSLDRRVMGYKPSRKGYYCASQDYIDGVWGDKNLCASLSDLTKFDRAHWEGSLLSPENLQEALQPGSPRRHYNYGFGWRLHVQPTETTPYHFGWWRGFRTCYLHDPATGLSMIILSNVDDTRRIPNYWETFHTIRSWYPQAEGETTTSDIPLPTDWSLQEE